MSEELLNRAIATGNSEVIRQAFELDYIRTVCGIVICGVLIVLLLVGVSMILYIAFKATKEGRL